WTLRVSPMGAATDVSLASCLPRSWRVPGSTSSSCSAITRRSLPSTSVRRTWKSFTSRRMSPPPARPRRMATARRPICSASVAPDGSPWFTYVGGFTPHKHLDRIVRAHGVLVGEALERGVPLPYLVLVGTTSADNFHGVGSGIHEAIAQCGTEEFVRWTGFVP